MIYRCLNRQEYERGPYRIVPIREEDMEKIRQWRNAQIAILRQSKPLSIEDQRSYWKETLSPSFDSLHPKQVLFSFLHLGGCIGYGGITHIDWEAKRGEVSFLLEPSRTEDGNRYRAEYMAFLSLLREAVFGDLKFHRIFAETFDVRPDHVAALEAFGFKKEGVLKDHAKVGEFFADSLIHGLINDE